MSEKLNTIGMLNSNFELEIWKQDSNFTFFLDTLIDIDSLFKYNQ